LVTLRTVETERSVVDDLQILSKDSVTVAVDAVVYYRVSNATISITNVEDANRSTRLLAQTTLRNVLGTKNLSEILSDRENISHFMQVQHSNCNWRYLYCDVCVGERWLSYGGQVDRRQKLFCQRTE